MKKKIHAMKFILFLIVCYMGASISTKGQDSLLDQLEKEAEPMDEIVSGTFKGTRLINGHSVEVRSAGTLDFLISHRFGTVNSGAYNFFGLDQANIRLGLDYALSDRITIGLGRNSFLKIYDGFLKYKLLGQQSGQKNIPVSILWFSNAAINTLSRPDLPMNLGRRTAYTHQLLIARKFNNELSLQMMPSYVHRNLVAGEAEDNGVFSLGLGGRYKLTNRVSVNLEYFYRFDGLVPDTYNAFAIGFDIETGGHVFQLHFTNAQQMTEMGFIPGTTGNFFQGDIHFGFNITRSFHMKNGNSRW